MKACELYDLYSAVITELSLLVKDKRGVYYLEF